MYTLHTCHYAQSYYNFGESLSAPCLFYQYDFSNDFILKAIYKQMIMYFIIHKKDIFIIEVHRCI